jgi:uncharacterized protein YegJ (DUF2314 family)
MSITIGGHIHARFPPHGEGMWVKVISVGKDGMVEGILANRPIDSPEFKLGQKVRLKHDEKEGWVPE